MPEITIELIRKRAEHNEGLIHTLEELSLHQEELEAINETLGCNCRRLKILYLQNNIIGQMRHLHHMKELEYLNLALNNISKVEGLHSCEFLNKLDLTVNFVDLDELESSITGMEGNQHLRDLYMMGNPCQAWDGFESYVIARLPQLERLDGKEITRTVRIRAEQRLPACCAELPTLAEEVRQRKQKEEKEKKEKTVPLATDATPCGSTISTHPGAEEKRLGLTGDCDGGRDSRARSGEHDSPAPGKDDEDGHDEGAASTNDAGAGAVADVTGEIVQNLTSVANSSGDVGGNVGGDERQLADEELTKHTPEVRTAIYREMAEQKKEKDDRQKENLPKDRNFNLEQEEAVEKAREREAQGTIRQCNEGKLAFRFEETRASPMSSTAWDPYSDADLGGAEDGNMSRQHRSRGPGNIVLEVSVPRYLDSSLIDLDVHPHYVSIVIKGKVLRLTLQAEVKAGEAKARRSKTTGSLVVTMPKVDPQQYLGLVPTSGNRRAPAFNADRLAVSKSAKANDVGRTKRRAGGNSTLAALMMQEAKVAGASGKNDSPASEAHTPREAVSVRGIVGPRHGGLEVDSASHLTEVVSSSKQRSDISVDKDRITEVIGSDRIIDAAASQVFSSSTATLPIPPARKRGEDEAISPGSEADFIFPPRPPSGKPLLDAYAEGIVT